MGTIRVDPREVLRHQGRRRGPVVPSKSLRSLAAVYRYLVIDDDGPGLDPQSARRLMDKHAGMVDPSRSADDVARWMLYAEDPEVFARWVPA